jgi:hypothetical protein
LTATSALAFIAQLKEKPWRLGAQLALLAAVLLVGWNYWP